MKGAEKNWKEKKKKYLRKKQEKRKNSDFTSGISVNITNSNFISQNKRKNPSQIVYYNYNKKDHFT